MPGHYERVNTQDNDDPDALLERSRAALRTARRAPNSPPPSFHSRTSSLERRRQAQQNVDPTLADAFDDDDDSDDEADDRQRLVRSNTLNNAGDASRSSPPSPPQAQAHWSEAAAAGNNAAASGRIYGGGIQSDGVFSNMTARPEREKVVEEMPPTYEQAAADAAPPYWETTILAPGIGGADEVYIDGMPVGSIFSFIWNGLISMSFQPFIGFLLTYLLHSTHAAKNGSRSGLGITFIQYGFYMKGPAGGGDNMGSTPQDGYAQPPDPNSHEFDPNAVSTGSSDGSSGGGLGDLASSEWIAYVLMVVGWFILIRAVSDYLKARRHEILVLTSPDRGLPVPIIAAGEPSERVV